MRCNIFSFCMARTQLQMFSAITLFMCMEKWNFSARSPELYRVGRPLQNRNPGQTSYEVLPKLTCGEGSHPRIVHAAAAGPVHLLEKGFLQDVL